MNIRSKSTLFLIEQLIVIAVFAISAAACITILASSYLTAVETHDIKNAILVAENVAETFKATIGSPDAISDVLGGSNKLLIITEGDNLITTIYYDNNWQICSEYNASYVLKLIQPIILTGLAPSVITGELSVSKIDGETLSEIISFPVAARVPVIVRDAD